MTFKTEILQFLKHSENHNSRYLKPSDHPPTIRNALEHHVRYRQRAQALKNAPADSDEEDEAQAVAQEALRAYHDEAKLRRAAEAAAEVPASAEFSTRLGLKCCLLGESILKNVLAVLFDLKIIFE